jgi:AcrR family transcriptional regulator
MRATTATTPRSRGPGAARSERARHAILTAASELIARDGYERLTIEGIAARAHVGKPTIYRWWPSKSALIAECLADDALMQEDFVPPNTGDLAADLATWFRDVAHFLGDAGNGTLIRSLIAASMDNPLVATELTQHIGARPEALQGRLQAAADSGQLAPDVSIAHVVDLITGGIVIRIIDRTGLEAGDAEPFVRALLRGVLR